MFEVADLRFLAGRLARRWCGASAHNPPQDVSSALTSCTPHGVLDSGHHRFHQRHGLAAIVASVSR
jgi:hypothetical protein